MKIDLKIFILIPLLFLPLLSIANTTHQYSPLILPLRVDKVILYTPKITPLSKEFRNKHIVKAGKRLPYYSISPLKKKKFSLLQTLRICRQFKKSDSQNFCIPNFPTLISEVTESGKDKGVEKKLPDTRCPLFKEASGIQYDGRSDYWAQEAVGADLVDEERSQTQNPIREVPVYVCDSGPSPTASDREHSTHGEQVKAIVDGNSSRNSSIHTVCQGVDDRLEMLDQIKSKNSFPTTIVNNSAYFLRPDLVSIPVEATDHVHWVQSSGNFWAEGVRFHETLKAHSDDWFIVGSVDPFGLPSGFSEENSAVIISAPSDNSITACPLDRDCQSFGGTSGAAPQLTHILKAIGEHYPIFTRNDLRTLIKKSALPMPFSFQQPQLNGAGSLNSYKMWRLAKAIASQCQQNTGDSRHRCVHSAINNSQTYIFEVNVSSDGLAREFPTCFSSQNSQSSPIRCSHLKKEFDNLRKAAFLKVNDQSLWNKIACIQSQYENPIASQFYKNIGRNYRSRPFSQSELQIDSLDLRAIRSAPFLAQQNIAQLPFTEDLIGRINMVAALWKLHPVPVSRINQAATDSDAVVRARAMVSASHIGEAGLSIIRRTLQQEPNNTSFNFVQIAIAENIHHQGESGLEIWRSLLHVENSLVRYTAIQSGLNYGKLALDDLVNVTKNDSEVSNREMAQYIIENIKSTK